MREVLFFKTIAKAIWAVAGPWFGGCSRQPWREREAGKSFAGCSGRWGVSELAEELRRLAGPEDGTPEGELKAGVTASISILIRGVTYARHGSPELRMKHYVRLRAALLALADEIEGRS